MAELFDRPAWHAWAACRGRGPEVMFPDRGGEQVDRALELCAGCSVVAECAAAGAGERFGVWGGEPARVRILRARAAERAAAGSGVSVPTVTPGSASAQRARGDGGNRGAVRLPPARRRLVEALRAAGVARSTAYRYARAGEGR